MTFEFIAILILAFFFVFIGWRQRQLDLIEDKDKDKTDPINYPRIRELITSLFVVIGAGEYAFAIESINSYGFIGPTFLIGLGISLFIISKFIPTVYQILEKNPTYSTIVDGYRNFTTPDIFYFKFGKYHSLITTIIVVIAFTGLLVLQHVLGGELLSIVTGMSYEFCVFFMGVIVCFYVILGGFKALFHTDVIQGIFMWVALIALAIYIFLVHPQDINYSSTINDLAVKSYDSIMNIGGDQTIIIFFILTVIAAFGGPDLWQRVSMSSSAESAVKGVKIAGWTLILFIIPISIIAIDINALDISLEGDALTNYLKELNNNDGANWPLFMRAIFGIGLVSAFISTGDTAVMLVSTSLQNEMRRWNFIKAGDNRNLKRKHTNLIILIISTLAVFLATLSPSIADQFVAILGVLAIMGLPVFQILIGRGTKTSVMIGLLLGIIITIFQVYILSETYSTGWLILLPLLPAVPSFFIKAKTTSNG